MQSVLLDAGALVAILNRNDRHHAELSELLEGFEGRLFTTWPVIGETCALVSERAQVRVLDWIAAAGVEIVCRKKGASPERANPLYYLVGRAGFEPATNGLKVRCSTS